MKEITGMDIRLAQGRVQEHRYISWEGLPYKTYFIGKMVSGQVNSGRVRYALKISLIRTIRNALFRVRPLFYVVGSWSGQKNV